LHRTHTDARSKEERRIKNGRRPCLPFFLVYSSFERSSVLLAGVALATAYDTSPLLSVSLCERYEEGAGDGRSPGAVDAVLTIAVNAVKSLKSHDRFSYKLERDEVQEEESEEHHVQRQNHI